MDYCSKRRWAANLPQKERGLTYHRVTLMKIPISGKIPRSYGPLPLQKGAIGGFLGVGPDPLRLIFMRGVVRVVHELLCGEPS